MDQLFGRPLDVQVHHISGIEPAEVEAQPVPVRDGHVAAPPAAVVGGDLGGRAVPEPGHDPGGLGRVGRRDIVSDQRIDQRGLACLEGARQRDADGLVEPRADAFQFVENVRTLTVGRLTSVRLDGAAQNRADPIACAHPRPMVALGRNLSKLSVTWRRMSN